MQLPLKLTNVARSSLEELRLDYEDFLRQNNLFRWELNDPRRQEVINKRFNSVDEFALWVNGQQGGLAETAANGALALLTVTCILLDRQLASQAKAFQQDGGFTERLYRARTASRKG